MRDLLPHLFQVATGVGLVIFLVTALKAGEAKKTVWGRLFLFALLLMALGFLIISTGAGQSSLGRAAPMLIFGGVAWLGAAVLTAAGVFVLSRDRSKEAG